MQAIMVSEFGGPEVLQPGEAPRPEPRAGDVLVRVVAAGVGPWDVTLRRGGWTGRPALHPRRGVRRVCRGRHRRRFRPGPRRAGVRLPGPDRLLRGVRDLPGRKAGSRLGGPVPDRCRRDVDRRAHGRAGTDRRAGHRGGRPRADHRRRGRARSFRGADRPHPGRVGHRHGQPAEHHQFVHRLGAANVIDHTRADWPDQVRELTGGGAERVLACAAPPWTAPPGRPGTGP